MSTPPSWFAEAAISQPFLTLEQVKQTLGIPVEDTSQDVSLTRSMGLTIAVIERYLGRGISFARTVQKFAPVETRNPKLLLYRFPIATVHGVLVDGVALPASAYRVIEKQGVLQWRLGEPSRWPAPSESPAIEVDYEGGYPEEAWPPDLLEAVSRAFYLRWQAIAGNIANPVPPGTVRSVTVDGLQVQYEVRGDGMGALHDEVIPPDIAHVAAKLEPYRVRLATGV